MTTMRTWGIIAVIAAATGCAGATAAPRSVSPGAKAYFFHSADDVAETLLTSPAAKAALRDVQVTGGIDSAGDLTSEAFRGRVAALKAAGFKVHVYLEGPGGKTGSDWEKEECARIREAARRVGVQGLDEAEGCADDKARWMVEWRGGKFLEHLEAQLKSLVPLEIDSVEVDNLDAAGLGRDGKPLELVERFVQMRQRAGGTMKLLLKNLAASEVKAVLASEHKAAISPFMIVEEGYKDDWCGIATEAAGGGVRAIFSWDTHHYHAEGDDQGLDLVLGGPNRGARPNFHCSGE